MRMLIAVPIFNEEKYVTRVLREILRYGHDVLVVDDGSTDRTPVLLKSLNVRVITHPENRGYGQSLIDAFGYAAQHGYDWVLTMDCDEQHEPAKIPDFYQAALADDADIISGSRYMITENDADAPPVDRRNINRIVTELVNSVLSFSLTDTFCGFKAHRVSAMQKLNLNIPGYAFPMQFWVQAAANNLRITELPVKLIYKDATRHFGGMLDDPSARLQHYLEVLTNELKSVRSTTPAQPAECASCV